MIVGTVRELKDDEYRVGITPGGAEVLAAAGHTVMVESGAGVGSSYDDAQYAGHGAKVAAARRGKPMPNYWGPTHKNWAGGNRVWRGFGRLTQRRRALHRDGYQCQRCGSSGPRLCCHHVKDKHATGGVWDNQLSNLETLCMSCHGKEHAARRAQRRAGNLLVGAS